MADSEQTDSLTVEIDHDGVIVVRGDIDIAGGPILEVAILERKGEGALVIDLSDVYFIDSSGLRVLLSASRRTKERDSEVVLRNVNPEVARLLQLTGTTEQFAIEGSRD